MCEADAGARGRGPVGKRERARRVVWLCCTEIDYYVRRPLCTNHAGVTIQSPQVDINTVVAGVGTRFLFHNGGRGAEASLISPTGTRSVSFSHYYTSCTFGIPDKDPPAMTNAQLLFGQSCARLLSPRWRAFGGRNRRKYGRRKKSFDEVVYR